MAKKYIVEQFPKNKTITGLSDVQLKTRTNKKHIKEKTKICKQCGREQRVTEFYMKDKTKRRDTTCRDCRIKNQGCVEIGKVRFAKKILVKGFRRCSVCKDIKPLTAYTKSSTGYGGYSNNCYKCSNELHSKFLQKQKNEIGDFYVKQYALSNYGKNIKSNVDIDKYRTEIIQNRKAKYFLDGGEFVTVMDFARYVNSKYGVETWAVEKRINNGSSEQECTLSEKDYRTLKSGTNKGKIKVTDTITKREFIFFNTKDKYLVKMFSSSAITLAIQTGNKTRITKLSKYKNPCLIERI
jgi:hypothetical protein